MFSVLVLALPFVAAVPILDVDVNVQPIGQITSNGAIRYSLKYATAKRWEAPIMSSTWIPSNVSNPTALPLSCPQPDLSPSQISEDCLDVVLYVPPTAKTTKGGVPTIVWVHGGSFIAGSATGPGLDGSNLAVNTHAIVAVVQYRLGVLGLLPPSASATNNLGLHDVITALKFLHKVLPSFGGSPYTPHLMLAGQSSGASLVRALLGTPEASSLFSSAWLHSDPLDYGFLTASAYKTLRIEWLSRLGCASSDDCAQDMDLATLLAHQSQLLNDAPGFGPEFFPSEPLRPSPDSGIIFHTMKNADAFPHVNSRKPLVVSNVRDEATVAIYGNFADALPPTAFEPILEASLGSSRAASILNSSFYDTNVSDVRIPLQILGTDQVWRCAAWRFARQWAPAPAFTGVFTQGVTYPGNGEICTSRSAVCHQDDIMVVFGTGSQVSADVRALTREVQARYAAFVRSGSPNAKGLAQWRAGDATTHNLGGSDGPYPAGACEPGFWGEEVPFDYQILGE